MQARKKAEASLPAAAAEHLVLTVTELDQLVYKELVKQKAAKASSKGETGYVITDREKAKSQNVLPRVLNPLGRKGWRLIAVNKMECYIFSREHGSGGFEYQVLTPPDMDRHAMQLLQEKGHLKLAGFEGEIPRLEVTSPKDARIQKVLPQVLRSIALDGWSLCAINGPQLYIFSRPLAQKPRT